MSWLWILWMDVWLWTHPSDQIDFSLYEAEEEEETNDWTSKVALWMSTLNEMISEILNAFFIQLPQCCCQYLLHVINLFSSYIQQSKGIEEILYSKAVLPTSWIYIWYLVGFSWFNCVLDATIVSSVCSYGTLILALMVFRRLLLFFYIYYILHTLHIYKIYLKYNQNFVNGCSLVVLSIALDFTNKQLNFQSRFVKKTCSAWLCSWTLMASSYFFCFYLDSLILCNEHWFLFLRRYFIEKSVNLLWKTYKSNLKRHLISNLY